MPFHRHLFYLAGENDDAETYQRSKPRPKSSNATFSCRATAFFISSIPPSSFTAGLRRT